MRFHLTLARMAKRAKQLTANAGGGVGGKEHPHSLLLGLQLVQLSWKSAWRILKRQKEAHHMTSYTAPWHVLKRLECWSTDTCSAVFIAAPFTKARRQKPRSPRADGCITEMVIHTLLNTIHL